MRLGRLKEQQALLQNDVLGLEKKVRFLERVLEHVPRLCEDCQKAFPKKELTGVYKDGICFTYNRDIWKVYLCIACQKKLIKRTATEWKKSIERATIFVYTGEW